MRSGRVVFAPRRRRALIGRRLRLKRLGLRILVTSSVVKTALRILHTAAV